MLEMVSHGARKFRKGERIFLAIGLTLLGLWAVARVHGVVASRAAMEHFQADETARTGGTAPIWQAPASPSGVDFTLWSSKRAIAYKDSLTAKTDLPLAILRIPKINLEVPVFNDTDDLTLNRGVGRILGTAQVGQPGNLGIAGHRDGFFRGLKDVGRNDVVELIRPGGKDEYVITQVQIVNPEDVYVLDPTSTPTLTLVTCFPFYFVGNAPKRYVLTASLASSSRADESVTNNSISTGKKTNNKEKTR
jgi:sortase A